MKSTQLKGLRFVVLSTVLAGMPSFAQSDGAEDADASGRPRRFEVTITNLTQGQQLTPIVVATHEQGVSLFAEGSQASPELRELAEEGNNAPLATLLRGMPQVREVTSSEGLLNPGQSVTLNIVGGGRFNHFSVASMLIPTNDAFFALNGVEGPRGLRSMVFYSPAYDAGTEKNDQHCESIPGPFFAECGGPGGGARIGGGEGFVHIHPGIQLRGDLNQFLRDWRNPVAKVTIRPVH